MEKSLRKIPSVLVLASALLMAASVANATTPMIQTGPTAEITQDGLHRVDGAVMKGAWIKPGLELAHYTKIMVAPAGMTFKDVKRTSNSEYPLSDEQKKTLQETVLEVFGEELGKAKRYTVTTAPGPDVLLVRGAMLDVVSRVPPQPIGRGTSFVRTLGEATMIVELRDSTSGEILARAAERRSVSPRFVQRSNSVSNLAEVRDAARQWAGDLREQMDQFEKL